MLTTSSDSGTIIEIPPTSPAQLAELVGWQLDERKQILPIKALVIKNYILMTVSN